MSVYFRRDCGSFGGFCGRHVLREIQRAIKISRMEYPGTHGKYPRTDIYFFVVFYRLCIKQLLRDRTLLRVRICVVFQIILDARLVGVPAGVTQEEGRTGFLIHLPSAVLALTFLARRIQPFLSLVDREVEFCVPLLLLSSH